MKLILTEDASNSYTYLVLSSLMVVNDKTVYEHVEDSSVGVSGYTEVENTRTYIYDGKLNDYFNDIVKIFNRSDFNYNLLSALSDDLSIINGISISAIKSSGLVRLAATITAKEKLTPDQEDELLEDLIHLYQQFNEDLKEITLDESTTEDINSTKVQPVIEETRQYLMAHYGPEFKIPPFKIYYATKAGE